MATREDGQAQAWARLRAADDPHGLEFPADYDFAKLSATLLAVAMDLSRVYEAFCVLDSRYNGSVRDATFFGAIEVPVEATRDGRPAGARLSSFACLATVWGGPADAALITRVVRAHDWYVPPADLLGRPYDGPNAAYRATGGNWHGRFFGYV